MSFGIVFPGQGSQSVGMLADLAKARPSVRECFDEASQALGYDLWELCSNGPEDELNQTARTQPALLTAGVAVWRVWREAGGATPAVMAGHSLGEYTALACAGSLAFTDAVRLVARRGELMQEAVPEGRGGMAAILGLDDDAVADVCERAAQGEVVAPVNYNAPGQVVVAGNRSAVDRAVELAKEAGAKRAMPLAVSVPSHCELMRPAAEKLAAELEDVTIERPSVPVIHNVDAARHDEPAEIRDVLVRQLYSPVRWVESIREMRELGADACIEAGPGKVLAGLCKRIDRKLPAVGVYDSDTLAKALETTKEGGNAG